MKPHIHHKRLKIYQSWQHLAATFALLVVPFFFLLFFSKIANYQSNKLLLDVVASLARMVIAYFAAAFLGWVFAVLFYRGKRSMIALPIFDVLQSLPTFAILPLVISFIGSSDIVVVFFLIIAIIWPVFFSVINALKLVRHDWEEAADIAGLRGWKYLVHFLWPVSMSGLITGSVIGLGDAWEVLVATEIIAQLKTGLGSFFQGFSTNYTITLLGVLGVLLVIFSINKLIWLPLIEKSHGLTEE